MGLYTDSISTSVAFKVNEAQRDTDRNLRRLSSGDRILRPEDENRFADRLAALDQLDEALTGLYSQFLNLRLGDVWPQELEPVSCWHAIW